MPTMDRRIKGCRNVHCRYNKERKHLPLDCNYCPICGEKVGLVCRECFAEIEDLGKTHFRCDACEEKKAERLRARKDKLEKAGKKLATPAADAAVGIIQQVAVKQVKKVAPAAGQAVKKAMPVAGKAVKKAIVRH